MGVLRLDEDMIQRLRPPEDGEHLVQISICLCQVLTEFPLRLLQLGELLLHEGGDVDVVWGVEFGDEVLSKVEEVFLTGIL